MPLTVTVTDQNGTPAQKFGLPIPKDAVFLDAGYFCGCKYFAVVLDTACFVWSAPSSMNEAFTLLCVHGLKRQKVNICSHEQLYLRPSNNDMDEDFSIANSPLDGVLSLIQVYESARDPLRKDIIRYVRDCINMHLKPADPYGSVVPYLCHKWDDKNHSRVLSFMKALLEPQVWSWVPLENNSNSANPIDIMLHPANVHHKAISVAEVIIDYCIGLAKERKTLDFLEPIRCCLHDLTDPKKPYSEVGLKTLRRFGYFPAHGHRVILEYHVIAYPFDFGWCLGKHTLQEKGLRQNKNQVLHFSCKRSDKAPKDLFTRSLFTASFDMLWHRTGPKNEPTNELMADMQSATSFSWPRAFVSVSRRKLKVTNNATVECHPFEIAALDNPAIAALIEYKW
jgi:hypothetical protein